ncbi:MAG: endonuclease/exonuclease/phosphatase family protein [Bacteroidales bacterium]|jgi:hypothetical protein
MSKGIVRIITGTFSLLMFVYFRGFSQEDTSHSVRLMFYNVENLFDIYNDSLTDDDEFLPGSPRRWNSERYYNKINAVYKTIIAAGEFSPPALVGLCEIENRKVIRDLVYGTGLAKYDYDIIHEESPDPRGIDVCLIYRRDIITVFEYKYLIPDDLTLNKFRSRTVLYAKCGIFGDTIHFFLNHWPSRRGGVLAGDYLRSAIAEMIKRKSDSIAVESVNPPYIIIAGDFNSSPADHAIEKLTSGYESGISMINLSSFLPDYSGTYKYMGTWEMIDQIIVSDAVTDSRKGLCRKKGSMMIFNPDFLLKADPKYPGYRPYSTYLGYRYQGGFSDHLPVLLDLRKE